VSFQSIGIRILLGVVLVLAILFSIGRLIKPVWVEDFVLAAEIKPGWVIVEYRRPDCPPLKVSFCKREIPVPNSGYVCTSSSPDRSLILARYFLVDSRGRRSRLDRELWVHSRWLLEGPWETRSPDGTVIRSCEVVADAFWYGPPGSVKGDVHTSVRLHHPECP
jgi:hypothetical protein